MKKRPHTIILPKEDEERRRARAARVFTYLCGLSCDKAWELTVELFRRTRSNQQNRALWGLAYKVLEEETGNDPDDMHEYFLGEHTGWVTRTVFGRKRLVPRKRSHDMSTLEFVEFFDFIQRRAAETVGVFIPDPDPFWREHMAQQAAKEAEQETREVA